MQCFERIFQSVGSIFLTFFCFKHSSNIVKMIWLFGRDCKSANSSSNVRKISYWKVFFAFHDHSFWFQFRPANMLIATEKLIWWTSWMLFKVSQSLGLQCCTLFWAFTCFDAIKVISSTFMFPIYFKFFILINPR